MTILDYDDSNSALPNKTLDIKISGHIQDKKKGQPIMIDIVKPSGEIERLRISTIDKGYYSLDAKLDKKWQEGDYTVKAFYKNNEIASITFSVTDKTSKGFGGILLNNADLLEKNSLNILIRLYRLMNLFFG